MRNIVKTIGITCLVSGNLIGAGILGIPILAGIAGFWPSIGLMLVAGVAMTYSAIVLACRACEEQDPLFNYPTLYARRLGRVGKYVGTITNALVLYGLLTAYIAGGSIILAQLFGLNHVTTWLMLAFFAVMTLFTLTGVRIFEKFNLLLMAVLWIAFIIMVIVASQYAVFGRLQHMYLAFLLLAIPVIITGFHFHNLIPTLATHLEYNKKVLYRAIILGMIIGLVMNVAWLFVGVTDIPLLGQHSLTECYVGGIPANIPIDNLIRSKFFTAASMLFSLLAILTSYVANGLGLKAFCVDFSVTYLAIKNKWFPILLTFVPPLIIAFAFPHIFLSAIGIVGGIGIITLFGILPAIIDYQRGSRKIAVLFMALFVLVLIVQILLDLHFINIVLPTH